MNERDFSLNGVNFKLNKINAIEQFHIARRMAPILGDLLPVIGKLKNMNAPDASDDEKLNSIAEFSAPIMDGLSKLSDGDAQKILLGLLGAVEMEMQPAGWARIVVNGNLMFQNLELPQLFQLAGRAFMYNLSGFFNVLPQTSPGRG